MRRESHVRFCEGPGVKFPRATRLGDAALPAPATFERRTQNAAIIQIVRTTRCPAPARTRGAPSARVPDQADAPR